MSVGSGLQRAQAFMMLATGLYRASHLAVGIAAVAQHQRGRPVAWVALGVALASSLVVFGTARSRGWFGIWPPVADAVVVGCLLPFVAYAGGVRHSADIGWLMLLGGSASAVAAVAFGSRTVVIGVVAVLAVTHAVGYRLTGADVAVIAGHLNSLASSAVLAGVFWWYLRRQGSLLDAATAQALTAESQRARYAERIDHHRALHDTVLATLTAIASGRLDANAPSVRDRCAREAAYLRRLVQQHADGESAPGTAAALEAAVRSAESLGLRVSAQYHDVPELPSHASVALADALTEALNNVLRHAGTGHAYVTAARQGRGGGGDGRVVVTVVDRGVGFDPDDVTEGLGLRFSVRARMRETGGAAEADSVPGEGTRIELRWPS